MRKPNKLIREFFELYRGAQDGRKTNRQAYNEAEKAFFARYKVRAYLNYRSFRIVFWKFSRKNKNC